MAKMEVSSAMILCFLSLSLLVSSQAAVPAPLKNGSKKDRDGRFWTQDKSVGLVQRVCNKSHHYNLCVTAVEADPRSKIKSHRKGILHIVIDKTIANATAIKEYIDHILADNSTKLDFPTRNCLEGCSTNYGDSIFDLKHALSFLELKNVSQYLDLGSMLNSMINTPFECEQDFISVHVPYPLTGINNCVENLTDTSMAILDIIFRYRPKEAVLV